MATYESRRKRLAAYHPGLAGVARNGGLWHIWRKLKMAACNESGQLA